MGSQPTRQEYAVMKAEKGIITRSFRLRSEADGRYHVKSINLTARQAASFSTDVVRRALVAHVGGDTLQHLERAFSSGDWINEAELIRDAMRHYMEQGDDGK